MADMSLWHTGWAFVFINGGYGTKDLFLNDTGLQWTTTGSFGGWMGTHPIPHPPSPPLADIL